MCKRIEIKKEFDKKVYVGILSIFNLNLSKGFIPAYKLKNNRLTITDFNDTWCVVGDYKDLQKIKEDLEKNQKWYNKYSGRNLDNVTDYIESINRGSHYSSILD